MTIIYDKNYMGVELTGRRMVTLELVCDDTHDIIFDIHDNKVIGLTGKGTDNESNDI